MNYVAVALIFISTLFYLFIKTESKYVTDSNDIIINRQESNEIDAEEENIEYRLLNSVPTQNFFDRLSIKQKKIVGIVLATLSGLCYSQCNVI